MVNSASNLASQLHRVRVGLRPELQISRHIFGGEATYIVRDPVSFQTHRLTNEDYQVFVALTNQSTLGVVFNRLVDNGLLDRRQEDEFYRFVLSLTQRGVLNLPLSDGKRLHQRFEERRQTARKGLLMRALFLRVPLLQPDAFLDRTVDLVKPLFSRIAFVVWSLAILASLLIVASKWDEFMNPLGSMMALKNLPVLWSLLVTLKAVHEFGHAYACKRFGGEVPEMGAFFVLLTPCAYVDASSSWGFTNRWERVCVGLAGMYFESIAAMFALFVGVITPAGLVHDSASYAIVLATVVTIAFNANPLMRYDGYYILSDILGMPNLRSVAQQRARRLAALVLLGANPNGRAKVGLSDLCLSAFGAAAAVYKAMIVFGISLIIAYKLPLAGVAVAAAYVLHAFRNSVGSVVNYLRFSPDLEGRRRRAVAVSIALAAAATFAIAFAPMPGGIDVVAVVARLEEQTLRAETPGFVRAIFVANGDPVATGDRLCDLENIDVKSNAANLGVLARAAELEWRQAVFDDPATATRVRDAYLQLVEDYKLAQHQDESLRVRADRTGIVTTIQADQTGAFLRKGDPIATVGAGPWVLRILLTAEQFVDAQLPSGKQVAFRLAGDPTRTRLGTILTVASQGRNKVDHSELTHLAGGEIAVDPNTSESAEPLFEVTVLIDDDSTADMRSGSTAHVRLVAERKTLLNYLCRRGLKLIGDLLTVI